MIHVWSELLVYVIKFLSMLVCAGLGAVLGINVEHGGCVTDDYFTHFDGSSVTYDERWPVNHVVLGLQGATDTQQEVC